MAWHGMGTKTWSSAEVKRHKGSFRLIWIGPNQTMHAWTQRVWRITSWFFFLSHVASLFFLLFCPFFFSFFVPFTFLTVYSFKGRWPRGRAVGISLAVGGRTRERTKGPGTNSGMKRGRISVGHARRRGRASVDWGSGCRVAVHGKIHHCDRPPTLFAEAWTGKHRQAPIPVVLGLWEYPDVLRCSRSLLQNSLPFPLACVLPVCLFFQKK